MGVSVATSVPEGRVDDVGFLLKALEAHRRRWGFFVLVYEHEAARERVAAALHPGWADVRTVVADDNTCPDWASLEQAISQAASSPSVDAVQVVGFDHWLDPVRAERTEARIRAWNLYRDSFANRVAVPVLCWVRPAQVRLFATLAPDLWSWRAGVHRFADTNPSSLLSAPTDPVRVQQTHDNVDARSRDQRLERMAELIDALGRGTSSRLRPALALELADLHVSMGELDEAFRLLEGDALPTSVSSGDERMASAVRDRIADILQSRGQLDDALRIRRDEVLPVLERLGDMRSRAVTMGKIADILQARGQLDEALRIRQDEQLPVYERLGDVRSRAVTMGKIADILRVRGQLDEALRILRDEVHPAFGRLGDVLSRGVTMGRIADILQARGQFDEALRIRQDEELPVYERLGDVRSRAVTMGKIADILEARGQLDEALRIRQDEELPVYERLGDVRELLVGRTKVALNLVQRGRADDAQQAASLLAQALADARRLGLPEAAQIEAILARLFGAPDEGAGEGVQA